MATAKAHLKEVRIKQEVTEGVAPGVADAQLLRNVTCVFSLKKPTFESQERRPSLQRANRGYGVRSVEGTLSGELSPGTYQLPIAMAMRKAWAGVADIVGVSLTLGAAVGGIYPLTRSAGSWIADGIKIGTVIRPTVALNAANLVNLLVVDLTVADPDILQVVPLNGATLTPEGPIAACTVTVPGKRTWTPATGHTNLRMALEEWNPGIPDSALWLGNAVQGFSVNLPASGNATFESQFLGIRLATQAQRDDIARTLEYFDAPAALTTSRILQAVNGVMRYGAGQVTNITGLKITHAGNMSGEGVVGSNEYPEIDEGPVHISGEFTARFSTVAQRDAFEDETEASITAALRTSSSGTADFVAFTLSRIQIDEVMPDDPTVGPMHVTVRFTALEQIDAGGATFPNDATTMTVQDSLAP